jgi:hypothetical protein
MIDGVARGAGCSFNWAGRAPQTARGRRTLVMILIVERTVRLPASFEKRKYNWGMFGEGESSARAMILPKASGSQAPVSEVLTLQSPHQKARVTARAY